MARPVPAIERTMRILDAFRDEQAEIGVSELSRQLSLNKSTVHNIVQTLCNYRILNRNQATRKYRLGPGLIELGHLARGRYNLRELARPALLDLMQQTQHTVLLGMFENDGITIVEKAEPTGEMQVTAAIGQRLPFCAGSFGRVFAAWMDDREIERLLSSAGLRKFTATSITDPVAYKASLDLTRRQGYAVDETEEYLAGVWAVSAPVHGPDGIGAALTVVGFASRVTPEERSEIIHLATQAARRLSLRLD